MQRQYTYGNAIISQRQLLSGSWTASFYATDGHGNVRQLTNESGIVTDTYTYDAFGKVIAGTGTTPNVYLYNGERFDADLGLYHLRARSYEPDRGRFTTMDPHPGQINEPVSLHKYLYANADPINFRDPTGMATLTEYAQKIKLIALRVIQAVKRLGRAIACIFINVASLLASLTGIFARFLLAAIRVVARRMGLEHCMCKFKLPIGPFSGGAKNAPLDWTGKGEMFARVSATIPGLKISSTGGFLAGTFAFPLQTYLGIGWNPALLKDLGDLPGPLPKFLQITEAPECIPIRRGIVPGNEFGGRGGIPEVLFPFGF